MRKMVVIMLLLSTPFVFAQQLGDTTNQPDHSLIKSSDTPISEFAFGETWYPDSTIEHTTTYSYKKYYSYDTNNNKVLWMWHKNTGSGWENYRKYTYAYDALGNRTSYAEYDWDSTDWLADWRFQFTHNSSNQTTTMVRQSWDGTAWTNDWKTENTYDSGNLAMYVNYQWSGTEWTENYRHLMSYDAFNNLLSNTYQTWSSGSWVDDTRYAYGYDAQNNRTSFTISGWDGSAWVDQERTLYYYDSAGNIVMHEEYDWTGSEWAELIKYDYTYSSSNKLLTETLSLWRTNTWVPEEKITRTYNSSDYLTEEMSSVWRSSAWQDTIDFHLSYLTGSVYMSYSAYDGSSWNSANGFLVIREEPFDQSNVYLYGYEGTVYYREVTGIGDDNRDVPSKFSLKQNYPNPFNPVTSIEFTLPERAFTELIIYDMLGRKAAVLVSEELEAGVHQYQFNASNLSSGMYLYKLTSDGFSQIRKMMLLK